MPNFDEMLQEMREDVNAHPLEMARKYRKFLDEHPTHLAFSLAKLLGLSRWLIEERLEMLAEVEKAEAHGRTLGRAEAIQEKNERVARTSKKGSFAKVEANILNSFYRKDPRPLLEPLMYMADPSFQSMYRPGRVVKDQIPCLEPKCPRTVARPDVEAGIRANDWFCPKHQVVTLEPGEHDIGIDAPYMHDFEQPHQVSRAISNMPLVDRDGDDIWVTKLHEVQKVKDLDDSHLTNCISFLRRAAEDRIKAIGCGKVEDFVGPRYASLVKEAKRRAQCKHCKDGVASIIEGPAGTGGEVLCSKCPQGQKKQKERLEALVRIREATLDPDGRKILLVMILAILGGLSWSVVAAYMHALGLLK